MKKLTTLILIGGLIMLNACTNHTLETYEGQQPDMDVKSFFNGPIKAWGIA